MIKQFLVVILLFFISFFSCVSVAEHGYVLLVEGSRIYVDVGTDSGAGFDETYRVYEDINGKLDYVGNVKIVQLFAQGAVAEVVDLQLGKQIEVAHKIVALKDIVALRDGEEANSDNFLMQIASEENLAESYKPPVRRRSKALAWLTFSTGVSLGITAAYSRQRANSTYDLYRLSRTEAGKRLFKNRTKRLDRNSKILVGASIAGVALGSILLFINNDPVDDIPIAYSDLDSAPYFSILQMSW
ncbi:MAG: hypothetical protein VX289_11060 [Candidatus Poribacteria bacterium]|nr:hypothetical protein [Candidatus Poribacteria bacterium]